MSKYEIDAPDLQLTCDFGVWLKGSGSSICYCTSQERAELMIEALEALDEKRTLTAEDKES